MLMPRMLQKEVHGRYQNDLRHGEGEGTMFLAIASVERLRNTPIQVHVARTYFSVGHRL